MRIIEREMTVDAKTLEAYSAISIAISLARIALARKRAGIQGS